MLSTNAAAQLPQDDQLDLIFRALGDRTRRSILARLTEGPAKVTDLAAPFDMSLPAVGKHLRVLEKAGLIRREISGRIHNCALSAAPFRDVDQWTASYRRFWDETLEGLTRHLDEDVADR